MIKVKVTCAYVGECISFCAVYKVTCEIFLSVYMGNTQNTLKNRMEQHFQYLNKKVQYNNIQTFLLLTSLKLLTKN